jgi:type II secretory pathway pseudopilin PulG
MKSSRLRSRDIDPGDGAPAFSLVEILVALAVFVLMTTLLLVVTTAASRLWHQAEGEKARRQAARIVLESITRDLEAAAFPVGTTNVNSLNFVVNPGLAGLNNPNSAFWQASTASETPPGIRSEVGYFVQWKDATPALCRYRVPATNSDSFLFQPADWLNAGKIATHAGGLDDAQSRGLLMENVVGLWITLHQADGSTTGLEAPYDSRVAGVRPAYAEVSVAVADSRTVRRISSAGQITAAYAPSAGAFASNLPAPLREGVQIFRTRVQLPTSR